MLVRLLTMEQLLHQVCRGLFAVGDTGETVTHLRALLRCQSARLSEALRLGVERGYIARAHRRYTLTYEGALYAEGDAPEPQVAPRAPRSKGEPMHMIGFTTTDHATIKQFATDHACSMREFAMRAVDAYLLVQTFDARIARLERALVVPSNEAH